MRFIDLTGQKFGRLTVIERAENKGKKVAWLCQCECGNTTTVTSDKLKSGHIKSCGCYGKEMSAANGKKQCKDLTGQKFGRLTVLRRGKNYGNRAKWICQCECGNEVEVVTHSLKSGSTQSCGCYGKEQQKQAVKEKWKDEEYRKMQINKGRKQMTQKWENKKFRNAMHERMSGANSPSWKGGITKIRKHLREINSNWYEDCKRQADYTCQLTSKRGSVLNVHHLKSFSSIVLEAHELHNIEIKEQVKDYTEEELKLLEEYVTSYHKDNSNGIVLSEDVHVLFHQEYGYNDNTPEQYIEFRERYLAGEFKEILK